MEGTTSLLSLGLSPTYLVEKSGFWYLRGLYPGAPAEGFAGKTLRVFFIVVSVGMLEAQGTFAAPVARVTDTLC